MNHEDRLYCTNMQPDFGENTKKHFKSIKHMTYWIDIVIHVIRILLVIFVLHFLPGSLWVFKRGSSFGTLVQDCYLEGVIIEYDLLEIGAWAIQRPKELQHVPRTPISS